MKSRTVGVVGAGRVGAVLAAALGRHGEGAPPPSPPVGYRRTGYRITAVATVSAANRARVRRLLPGVPILPPDRAAAAADLVLLAVPDDALAGLVNGLVAAGALQKGQLVVHTSGAHGLAVLAPAAEVGARTLALHPAMTFTGTAGDLARLRAGVTFGVTAAPADRRDAARLVADLDGIPEWIDEAERPLYHAALAHGANHLVTLVNEAMDRLRDAGVADPPGMLAPLLRAALDNTLRLGDAALTGPVSRGDAGTVAGHLAALGRVAPASVPPYLALARRTADRAISAGRLRPADAGPLLEVLAESTAGAVP